MRSVYSFLASIKRVLQIIIPLLLFFLFSAEKTQAKIILLPISDLSSEVKVGKRQLMIRNAIALIGDIREKTGLLSIDINQRGELTYDRAEASFGGSAKMRSLVLGAMEDEKNTFQIIDISGSKDVHFSITDQGTVDIQTGEVLFQIFFDFSDFVASRNYSSKQAIQSFTPGLVLFHEIDHKVSYDPNDPIPASGVRPDKSSGTVRGVIENTNNVRAELGLIPRVEKGFHRHKYQGLVGLFGKSAVIPFRNNAGKRRFLRWCIKTSC